MTAVLIQPPSPGEVIIASLAVLAGALIAATSALLARRTGNWLHHLGTAGGLVIVAGLVGQRTISPGAAMGPWDAGVTVPLLGVGVTPVAVAGIILTLIGVALTMLFERIPEHGEHPGRLVHRSLEDDDAI